MHTQADCWLHPMTRFTLSREMGPVVIGRHLASNLPLADFD